MQADYYRVAQSTAIQKSHQIIRAALSEANIHPLKSFRSPDALREPTFSPSTDRPLTHRRQKSSMSLQDHNLMREIIGLRKSVQNINYKQTCMECKPQRTLQMCPQCGSYDSQRGRTDGLKSHRSVNSCTFANLGPMVEQTISPRGANYDYSTRSCTDLHRFASTKANNIGQSHHRYDMRTIELSPRTPISPRIEPIDPLISLQSQKIYKIKAHPALNKR